MTVYGTTPAARTEHTATVANLLSASTQPQGMIVFGGSSSNGVALSDEYLSGPEAAERVTRQLLDVYAKHDVRPLVEAPGVRTAKDLAVVSRLFGEPAPPAKERRL